MLKKKIALITGTVGTKITLKEQLEIYVEDFAKVDTYAIDEGITKKINADLVVISTELIYDDAIKFIQNKCPIIVARRVINYSEIEKLLFIPSGENVLFVNDCEETIVECIEWLKRLGISNYNFIPYYPGCSCSEKIKYAVTPGEASLVPKIVEKTIDIGPRLIDITTLAEILKALDIFEAKWDSISRIYLNKIIYMSKCLAEITSEKSEAYDNTMKVIDSVNQGLLAFNKEGIITVFNENLKFLLGVKKNNIIGKNIKEIIRDKEIQDFVMSSIGKASKVLEIRGTRVLISALSIIENNIKVVIFKDLNENLVEENHIRREIFQKGYFGKYTFKDIIGNSEELVNTKNIAQRLSATDLTVLIEGESGTGKELFASAIHNESKRRNKSFVAVNFSSLSESLVESELFGYEEGAFTGAIKGGKPGLFEQAEGGTIFLDEIGDISPRVQSRLLRVLQEKEIMRVGGDKIIPVNIRIIAATNQNLRKLVQEKKFREDLYHRLKVLYLKLPSLRNRKEDILTLTTHFIRMEGKENIIIQEDVNQKLLSYPFNGNVRELKNTIDYMIAVCDGSKITLKDLPEESFFQEHIEEKEDKSSLEPRETTYEEIHGRGDFVFILESLYDLNKSGEKGSRAKLLHSLRDKGINLSEQMIRSRLNELEKLGYIEKKRGRWGTTITPIGITKIKSLRD
ncbi:sigma 54-interacting transcriptional regulator [Clostridium sp.]|uniref:sigma-54 interaction domain-containing protein n=1 Tax=Clostridium sp. TaxID=1506 RepID=UPI002FC78F23